MPKRKKMYDDILNMMGADPTVAHGIAPPGTRGLVASDAQMMGGPGRPVTARDVARGDKIRDLHTNVMSGNYGDAANQAAGQATVDEIKRRETAARTQMDDDYRAGQLRGLTRLPAHEGENYVEVIDPHGRIDLRHKDSPEANGKSGWVLKADADRDERKAGRKAERRAARDEEAMAAPLEGPRQEEPDAPPFPPRANAAAPPQAQHNTEQAEQNHEAAQQASGARPAEGELAVAPESPSNRPGDADDLNWMTHPDTRIKYYPREDVKLDDSHFMPGHSPYRNSAAKPAPKVIGLTEEGDPVIEAGYPLKPGWAIHPNTNLPYDRNNPGRGVGVPHPRGEGQHGPGVDVNPDTSYMPTLHPAYRDNAIAGEGESPGWLSSAGEYTPENAPKDVRKAVKRQGELSAPSRMGYGYAPDAPQGEAFPTPYGPNVVAGQEELATPEEMGYLAPPMGQPVDTISGQAQRRQRRADRSPREMVEEQLEDATSPDIRPDPSQHLGILQRIRANRDARRANRQQRR